MSTGRRSEWDGTDVIVVARLNQEKHAKGTVARYK